MNCEHCKLPRDRLHDCMHSLMDEVARLKSVAAEFHNIDDVVEIRRLKQQFSLAEEGLANYAQENERLKSEILEARRVGRPPKALWLQEPQTQPQLENNDE